MITAEEFIEIWQKADVMDEVVEKTGLSRRTAAVRASTFRRQGVPLKFFNRHNNWSKLAKLAKSLTPKE